MRARAQLDEVLRSNPGHARAKALEDAIGRGEPPLPQSVASANGAMPASAAPGTSALPIDGDHSGVPRDEHGEPVGVPAGRSFDYYIQQAETARNHGQCSRAIPLYEQALVVRPGSSEALSGLGHCQLSSGDASGAITRFRATLDVNPSYALAHFGLAEAYRQLGRRREAAREYREFLALMSNGRMADTARSRLSELEGDGGGGGSAPPPQQQPPPPTGSGELPAPIGTPGSGVIQQSDTLTEDSEPPLRPGEHP